MNQPETVRVSYTTGKSAVAHRGRSDSGDLCRRLLLRHCRCRRLQIGGYRGIGVVRARWTRGGGPGATRRRREAASDMAWVSAVVTAILSVAAGFCVWARRRHDSWSDTDAVPGSRAVAVKPLGTTTEFEFEFDAAAPCLPVRLPVSSPRRRAATCTIVPERSSSTVARFARSSAADDRSRVASMLLIDV